MASVEKSIVVDVPVSAAYNQWTQLEDFPKFMEGVEDVRQQSDALVHWKAKVAGKVEEWDAEIVHQVPDQRIAWRSVTGATNSGDISFEALDARQTRVVAHVEYEPEGLTETIGDKLGLVSRRVEGDLERFKKFIEERGTATGAWRGDVKS